LLHGVLVVTDAIADIEIREMEIDDILWCTSLGNRCFVGMI
jgi:hypothetical protein